MRLFLYARIIFSLISLTSISVDAKEYGLSKIPIESEFGITLGNTLASDLVAMEKEKKHWVTSRSYLLKPSPDHSYTVRVGTTDSNKIYWISATKEVENCKSEFQAIRESFETKYEVNKPPRDFIISNVPIDKPVRQISGICAGQSVTIRVNDKVVGSRIKKINNVAYKAFKQSLPVCVNVYLRPINWGWASSMYGKRTDPFTGKPAWHDEIDFAGKLDQLVYASDSGVVLSTSFDKGYGNRVEIEHSNGDVTTYSQLNSFLVHIGALVEKGQPIAKLGSTGRSTGPHVGFGLKRSGKFIDPMPYMVKKDTCRPVYKDLN